VDINNGKGGMIAASGNDAIAVDSGFTIIVNQGTIAGMGDGDAVLTGALTYVNITNAPGGEITGAHNAITAGGGSTGGQAIVTNFGDINGGGGGPHAGPFPKALTFQLSCATHCSGASSGSPRLNSPPEIRGTTEAATQA